VPAACPRLACQLGCALVAPHRGETVRVHPRRSPLPSHQDRYHRRLDAVGYLLQQGDALVRVGQELLDRKHRSVVENALRPDGDVDR